MRVSAATVQSVIRDAVRASATAIHFEPQQKKVRVAYRIDGRLVRGIALPAKFGLQLIVYIKKLAGLHNASLVPQEGRFQLIVDAQPLTLRVSTLPLIEHEKLVIHIAQASQFVMTPQQLGLWGSNLSMLQKTIQEPHGLILTSGPIGSGTSTTLYALLGLLKKPDNAITTIEETILWPLEDITQTQLKPKYGLTYAVGIKAALRQDPNIIMVDTISNPEALEAMLQGALGGHMVLSTVHAPGAIRSLGRLQDLGTQPFAIAAALRAITNQRLIRTLCPNCKIEYKPEKHEVLALLHACLHKKPASLGYIRTLEQQAAHEGLGQDIGKSYSIKNNNITRLWKARPSGCNVCRHTGYKGRVGIFEVLPATPDLQTLLINQASIGALQNKAVEEGMLPLQLDGLIKVLRGMASSEELLKVLSSY